MKNFYTCIPLIVFIFLLLGCNDNSVTGPKQPSEPLDLDVAFIKRLPEINYVTNSESPETDGWPEVGQEVTWKAHIKNRSNTALQNVSYQWTLDGQILEEGTIDVDTKNYETIELALPWDFVRKKLSVSIDHRNELEETTKKNNKLSIYTDALSMAFYVEKAVYDYFNEHQYKLGIGSNSFEDWAQRQISIWNEIFSETIYPHSPQGVIDRIRLDQIHIVPDGAIPLAQNSSIFPGGSPNTEDKSVDLQWGLVAKNIEGSNHWLSNHTVAALENDFYFSGFVFHEILHARYLIHPSSFDIYHDYATTWNGRIDIKEGNKLAVNTPYMPKAFTFPGTNSGIIYQSKYDGIMNSVGNVALSEYSAVALNRIADHRATRGNYHVPDNFGIYVFDIPKNNSFKIINAKTNEQVANATLTVYTAFYKEPYNKYFDDIPDYESVTGPDGVVSFSNLPDGKDLFGLSENSESWLTHGNLIIRVETDLQLGYSFFARSEANVQYMAGNTQEASYNLKVTLKNK